MQKSGGGIDLKNKVHMGLDNDFKSPQFIEILHAECTATVKLIGGFSIAKFDTGDYKNIIEHIDALTKSTSNNMVYDNGRLDYHKIASIVSLSILQYCPIKITNTNNSAKILKKCRMANEILAFNMSSRLLLAAICKDFCEKRNISFKLDVKQLSYPKELLDENGVNNCFLSTLVLVKNSLNDSNNVAEYEREDLGKNYYKMQSYIFLISHIFFYVDLLNRNEWCCEPLHKKLNNTGYLQHITTISK